MDSYKNISKRIKKWFQFFFLFQFNKEIGIVSLQIIFKYYTRYLCLSIIFFLYNRYLGIMFLPFSLLLLQRSFTEYYFLFYTLLYYVFSFKKIRKYKNNFEIKAINHFIRHLVTCSSFQKNPLS